MSDDASPFVRPKFLTILTPMSNGRRGGQGGGDADKPRTFRMSDDAYETLKLASDALKINPAEFIRWVLYNTANEVLAQQHIQTKKK